MRNKEINIFIIIFFFLLFFGGGGGGRVICKLPMLSKK